MYEIYKNTITVQEPKLSQCSFRGTLCATFQSCLQMLPFPSIKAATRRNNS